MMPAKRVAASLPAIIVSLLLTGLVALAMTPAKALATVPDYAPLVGADENETVEVTTWSQLYEQLQDNGSKIKLAADVKFGTGGGEHESDALVVQAGFSSTLDLNGHIVDRGLGEATEAVEGGSVIDVFGELTITDSQPNAAHNPAVTFVGPLSETQETVTVKGGIITGGYAATLYESASQRCYGGGGALVERNAHLIMAGGSICGNRASAGSNDGGGGGVAVKPGGVFDMSGNAVICGNICNGDGGGVWLSSATLNMDGDASIYGNSSSSRGGGVSGHRTTIVMKGNSRVYENLVSDGVNGWGGGIDLYMMCTLTMEGNASITSNVATGRGGGVSATTWIVATQTITMKDNATISDNTSGDFGGGLYVQAGQTVLNVSDEASITRNDAGDDGGGVFVDNGATLNMSDEARISDNTSSGSGGGVNLYGGSKLNIAGGTITGNSARYGGGGIFANADTPTFTISGTVVIFDNETVDDNGYYTAKNNIHGEAGSGSTMATPITVTGELDEDSLIGITQWGAPDGDQPVDIVAGFAENSPGTDPALIFRSDSTEYILVISSDGQPQLALPEGVGVWIGGKRVNVLNASDVFGDGTVIYDRASKTLTLNGYQFDGWGETTHHAALATTVENLTVNVIGDNKIVESGSGTDCFGIWAENGLTFTGSGKLWAHANGGIGAYAAGDVLISGGQVKFSGDARAVEAASVSLGKDLAVIGSEEADAENGVVLATNSNADSLDITALVGETYKSVWAKPLAYYDLWVNGQRFNTVNLTIACGEGTATFDPDAETPTLTLTNATITNPPIDSVADACIYSELSDLVIKTVGDNIIKPSESGIDGVRTAAGCNVSVVGADEASGSLVLDAVNYGFNVGGTINIGGHLETTSVAGGTNVPDSAITLAPGWGYTTGTSLTQSGKVVIGQVFTVTFDGNGHGGVLATLQVPKGKSINDVTGAMSEEDLAAFTAQVVRELADGGKTYQVDNYYTEPECAIQAPWSTSLDKDITLYAKWIECITLVEITVEAPVCGTETTTQKNVDGNWDFSTQTNKPVGSTAGQNYVLPQDGNGWNAGWANEDVASIVANGDVSEAYIGTFVGGASYTLVGTVSALNGLWFSKDVVAKVNGVECTVLRDPDPDNRGYIALVAEVAAVHDVSKEPTAAEVPATCTKGGVAAYWKCSVCGKLFRDSAGKNVIGAPVAIAALGHAWSKWSTTKVATCGKAGEEKRVCGRDASHVETRSIPATGKHSWDAGAVTKEPTTKEAGVRTFTCTACGTTRTEAIPKLVLGKGGTGVGPGASAATAEFTLTEKAKGESEPEGTTYRLLRAKVKKVARTSVTLAWTKVKGAKKYVVYGNKCGKTTRSVRVASTTKLTKKFTKMAGKKVQPKTFYKFNIVALDKNNKVISTSKTIHVVTKGSKKYCNEVKVVVEEAVRAEAQTLEKGKKLKLKAKALRSPKDVEKKLKLAHHRGVAYESSNPKVATVSAKGVVRAKKEGTCYIYAYAQNGVSTKVKVVVKSRKSASTRLTAASL